MLIMTTTSPITMNIKPNFRPNPSVQNLTVGQSWTYFTICRRSKMRAFAKSINRFFMVSKISIFRISPKSYRILSKIWKFFLFFTYVFVYVFFTYVIYKFRIEIFDTIKNRFNQTCLNQNFVSQNQDFDF